MARYCATEGSPKAADLAFHSQFLDEEAEHTFCIVKAVIGCGSSLRPSISSIVPSKHVDLLRHKKVKPEGIGRMHLLLIALGILVEEDHRRVLEILRVCKVLLGASRSL